MTIRDWYSRVTGIKAENIAVYFNEVHSDNYEGTYDTMPVEYRDKPIRDMYFNSSYGEIFVKIAYYNK